jgi:cytochrome c oxidase subunit 2
VLTLVCWRSSSSCPGAATRRGRGASPKAPLHFEPDNLCCRTCHSFLIRLSSFAGQVDGIYLFGVAVSLFFSALIAVLVLVLAVKYRRRRADQIGSDEHPPDILEIVWSVVPLGILMVMFFWGARVFFTLRTTPPGAVEYYAVAKRWMWKFQHPSGNREINELHVPVGQTVVLKMTSEDVIHDFFVPAFRTKYGRHPGRYT